MLPNLGYVRLTTRVLGVAACLTVLACAKEEPAADTTAAMSPGETVSPAPAAPAISDPEIAHVAVTANGIDSSTAALARTKARSKAVKDFAQTMITDHAGVNKQAVALVTKLAVTPQENDVSRKLKTDAETAWADLKTKSGAEFDKAYIAHEVAYHQAVLDALDQTLVPNSQNAELKALLESVRPAFVAHLERAKQIQGTLGGS